MLRVVLAVLAALLILVFLNSQRQQSDLTFDAVPPATVDIEADTTGPQLPTRSEIEALIQAERVVRLPGAEAVYDAATIDPLLETHDMSLVLIPPGVPDEDVSDLDLADDVIVARGLQVSAGILTAVPSSTAELVTVFAGRDITDGVLALIHNAAAEEGTADPPEPAPRVTWREPTPDEMAAVLPALSSDGIATVGPADSVALPDVVADAFPGVDPAVIVTPYAEPGVPAVDYRAAVAAHFPDRPVVQLTGHWAMFAGPQADEYADAVTAGFYGVYGRYLTDGSYTQEEVLRAVLSRIAEFRFSGIFDRPAPEAAPDPVRVTLPWLPWLFTAIALGYVLTLVWDARRPRAGRREPGAEERAALAGLSEIAVELSGHRNAQELPSLDRALSLLRVSGAAIEADDLDGAARRIAEASTELDTAAREVGAEELRPQDFLPGRWS